MKFVTFIAAPEGSDPTGFQDWFAEEHVPGLVRAAPTLRGCVMRRKIDPPIGCSFTPRAVDPGRIAPFDVMFETWFPAADDFRREAIPEENRFRDLGARFVSYRALPRLHKDPRIAEAGRNGCRPELTFVILVRWLPTLTKDQGAQEWLEHTPICLRAQAALTKYEQNIITETISWTDGVPAVDAFADFSVRTVDDFRLKFVPTIEEMQDSVQFRDVSLLTCFGDAEGFDPHG